MSRRYLYTDVAAEDFIALLNQELDDLSRRFEILETQKPILAGPDVLTGARRDALVRYKVKIGSGSNPGEITFTIQLNNTNCVDGAPKFKTVDWVGPMIIEEKVAITDTITGLTWVIVSKSVQKVVIRMTRETSAANTAWDFFIMFRVSGTV